MNKKERAIIFILIRYFVLLILGVFSSLFYVVFFYLTIGSSYFLLKTLYEVSLNGYVLKVAGLEIGIASACVAGSAYYLLLILNLTTEMSAKQRISSLFSSLFLLLAINVLRIFLFSILLVENYVYFDLLHRFFWYFMSIFFVVVIWFFTAWLFKIRRIPFYSDLKTLLKRWTPSFLISEMR